MTVVSADLGLLPDSALLRVRAVIGSPVTAECVFRDAARRPEAPPGPVVFLWRSPGNLVVELPGIAVAGRPGVYDCTYEPVATGVWALRVDGGGTRPVLAWTTFGVDDEPPSDNIPEQAIWLASPDTALVTFRGQHLAGATIPGFPAILPDEDGDLPAGLLLPAVDPDAAGGPLTGRVLFGDMLEAAGEAAISEVAGAVSAQVPPAVAAAVLSQVSPAVAAAVLSQVSPAVAAAVLSQVSPAVAAAVLAQVSPAVAAAVLSQVAPAVAAAVLAQAAPAVAAAVLAQVPPAVAAAVTSQVAPQVAAASGYKDAAANSAAAAAAIATAFPASVPVMAGYVYSFRLGRYYQEWGASRATVAQLLSDVLTVSRASVGTYFDASGNLVQAANNQPRIAYDFATLTPRGIALSEARTNQIRNPWFVGAVVGGANPTNMTLTGTTVGVTRAIAGFGVLANGLPYLDLSITGTATAASTLFMTLEGNSVIAAANGDPWTLSPYLCVPSGNPANLSLQLNMRMGDSGGSAVGGTGLASATLALSATLARFEHRAVLNQAAVAFVRPDLRLSIVSGTTYAETLRIVVGNMEKAAAASSPILPTSGTIAASTRLADATLVPDLAKIGWNNAAMTLAVRARVPALPLAGTIAGLWRADDGTENERFRAYINPDGSVTVGVTIGGVVTSVTPAGTVAPDTEVRIAAGFAAGVLRACINGGAIASATPTGNPYAMSRLRFGSADSGGATSMLNGSILEVAARQGALAGTDLQGLLA